MERWVAVLAAVVVVSLGVTGCGDDGPGRSSGVPVAAVPASSGPASEPAPAGGGPGSPPANPAPGGPAPSDKLTTLITSSPGTIGLVVRDTVTGAVWQAGDPTHAAWTASTIKLAIATDLLERNRAGVIALTGGDRENMRKMLVNSDNDATDALWEKYNGVGQIGQFQKQYGMATLAVVGGYRAYWRHLQCSATDLAAVMGYALAKLPAADRTQLVGWLKAAAGVQQWGVPAAGSDAGHKPGWAFKPEGNPDHWVVHSVGFAGAGERYVVAVTYDQPKGRTPKQGAQVISDVVALAFAKPTKQVKGP